MREKKTKGKQKINIKKIEKDEDRMVTFSKRRSGIYTKLSELSILCGADVSFLVYSGAGKPFTFGSPSFDTVAERFLYRNHPWVNIVSSLSSSSIIDAHKKMKMEELCKLYNFLGEKSDAEEERGIMVSSLPVETDAWWKVDPKEIHDQEESKHLMKKFERLYEKLCEVAERKNNCGNVASSSSSLSLI